MKYALLFGINYTRSPQARLRGCINDVNNMAEYLREDLKYNNVKVYTDENNIHETGIQNIIHKIYKLAILSHRQKINQVYLHFSGHGTSTFDKNRDEKDGKDEAFVPSDYQRRGVISDDLFKRIFKIFNENTKVICIFDCCHSGTIADLKYKWVSEDRKSIENNDRPCRSNIITISGCRDNQTSADAYNVMHEYTFTGALSSCLLMTLKENQNDTIFEIVDKTRNLLQSKRFSQKPELCSSYIIDPDEKLF